MFIFAPFKSSYVVVRVFAWLVLFLLLVAAWILILIRLSLTCLFQVLGNLGLSEIQGIRVLTLLPPMRPITLIWLKWRKPGSATADQASVATAPEAIAPSVNTLPIAAWSAVTPFGDVAAALAGAQEKQAVFSPNKEVFGAEGFPFLTAKIEALPLAVFAYPAETRSRLKRTTAMLFTVCSMPCTKNGWGKSRFLS